MFVHQSGFTILGRRFYELMLIEPLKFPLDRESLNKFTLLRLFKFLVLGLLLLDGNKCKEKWNYATIYTALGVVLKWRLNSRLNWDGLE